MDLQFNCQCVSVSANSPRNVDVEISGANDGDILSSFNLKDILAHFGEDDLLEQIGARKAMEYFDLQENTSE